MRNLERSIRTSFVQPKLARLDFTANVRTVEILTACFAPPAGSVIVRSTVDQGMRMERVVNNHLQTLLLLVELALTAGPDLHLPNTNFF